MRYCRGKSSSGGVSLAEALHSLLENHFHSIERIRLYPFDHRASEKEVSCALMNWSSCTFVRFARCLHKSVDATRRADTVYFILLDTVDRQMLPDILTAWSGPWSAYGGESHRLSEAVARQGQHGLSTYPILLRISIRHDKLYTGHLPGKAYSENTDTYRIGVVLSAKTRAKTLPSLLEKAIQ